MKRWSILLITVSHMIFSQVRYQNIVSKDSFLSCPRKDAGPPGFNLSSGEIGKSLADSSTTLVGRWAHGPCFAVAVAGDTAFFGDGGYLVIVDFSNSDRPVEIGHVVMPGIVTGVAFENNYVYVANGRGGLQIVDVGNPSNPEVVAEQFTGGWALDVFVNGNYAYIGDQYTGLRIIDVSDPLNPEEVGYYDTEDYAWCVYVAGNYAYVANGRDGLRMVDISDPSDPREVGYYDTGGSAQGVCVVGSYAYVADGTAGFRVIDISDPSSPQEVGYYDTAGWYAYSVCVIENCAYIADGGGLRIIDVSDPSNPQEIGHCYTVGWSFDVCVSGNCVYMANDCEGVCIIDVSDRTNPVEVGSYDTGGRDYDIHIVGNYAYIADGRDGLQIVDMSDPLNPREVGCYDTEGLAVGVCVMGNYAYIADDAVGLQIVDVGDPSNPQGVGYYDTKGHAESVYIAENYAYVADGSDGLRIIDVSDPSDPQEAGYYDTEGYAYRVYVVGDCAYVADRSDGLRIIDVSNPSDPQEAGYYDTKGYAESIYIVENYAYMADGGDGLRIIDVSDPSNPREEGYYQTGDQAVNVYARENYVYVADYRDGLYVVKNDLISPYYIYVDLPEVHSSPGDTVELDIEVELPADLLFSSAEFSFNGYHGLMEFVRVDRSGTMIDTANWSVECNETDSLLYLAFAGAKDITGAGVLCKLVFFVSDSARDFIPVNPVSVLFNTGRETVIMDSGGVRIPRFGDVDLDGCVEIYDATRILEYRVGKVSLSLEQLLNANVSGDTTVSALDVSIILQYLDGASERVFNREFCKLPVNGFVSLGDTIEVFASQFVDVPMFIEDQRNIYAFEMTVDYDYGYLQYMSTFWSDLVSGYIIEKNLTEGKLLIAGGGSTTIGDGNLLGFLRFRVSKDYNGEELEVRISRLRWNESEVQENVAVSHLIGSTSANMEGEALPERYALKQNCPNPFNPVTRIWYEVPERSKVEIRVYNVTGSQIETLVDEEKKPGVYSVVWDASGYSSGVYLIVMEAPGFRECRKCLLVK